MYPTLTEEEATMLVLFQTLDPRRRSDVIEMLADMVKASSYVQRKRENGERLDAMETRVAARRIGLRLIK